LKKDKASKSIAVMFSKHHRMRWRETFGMLDLGIVDEGDPDPKKLKSETTVNKSGVSLIHSLKRSNIINKGS
jgi:hypothetical protein